MKRILIEDVKWGITDGGFACGPVAGSIVASIKYTEGKTSRYLSLSEFDGFAAYYETKKPLFDTLMINEMTDEELEFVEQFEIGSFHRIKLDYDYDIMMENLFKSKSTCYKDLLRLLIAIVRLDTDLTKELCKDINGKYLDEISIPVYDCEEEYLESISTGA